MSTTLLHHTPTEWLGYSPDHPPFDEWLTASRVYERPHHAVDDEIFSVDKEKASQNAKLSLIEGIERLGICCVYETRHDYQRLFGPALSEGLFVLKEVVFYADGVQGYQGCKLALPFGLELGMSRIEIGERLGNAIDHRKVFDLPSDRYLCEAEYMVNVSYESDKSVIIHVRRIHEFDRRQLLPSRSPLVSWRSPNYTIESLVEKINCSAEDETLNAITRPLGWHSVGIDMSECHEIDRLIPEHGLALYYRQREDFLGLISPEKLASVPNTQFVGFRVNRAGDMRSNGFSGRLPFDLSFHDAPSVILKKMGAAPDKEGISDDIGYFAWNKPNVIVHAMYSLIDMQMYRLSLFSPIMLGEFSCK